MHRDRETGTSQTGTSTSEAPSPLPSLFQAVDSIFQSPEYLQAIGAVMTANPNGRDNIREVTIHKNGADWILPIRKNDGFRGFRKRSQAVIGGNEIFSQLQLGPAPIELTVNEDVELTERERSNDIFWKRDVWPMGNPAVDPELRSNSAWNDGQARERIMGMVVDFFAPPVEQAVPEAPQEVEVFASRDDLGLVAGGEFLTPKQIKTIADEEAYRKRTKDWPISWFPK